STHINLLYAYLFFFFTDTPTPEFYTLSLTTLFRSDDLEQARALRLADDDLGDVVGLREADEIVGDAAADAGDRQRLAAQRLGQPDRKSTRLNSSHLVISYAVFCLKKKKLCDQTRADHGQGSGITYLQVDDQTHQPYQAFFGAADLGIVAHGGRPALDPVIMSNWRN